MDTVMEINSLAEVRSLKSVWEYLHQQTLHPSFYQSVEWLEQYCGRCNPEDVLRVLFVTEAQEAVGILPLVERDVVCGNQSTRELQCPWGEVGVSAHPLGPHPANAMRAFADYLINQRRPRWERVRLTLEDLIECHGANRKQAYETVHPRFRHEATEHRPWIHCAGGFDRYWYDRGWDMRQSVDEQEMQLRHKYKLEFDRARSRDVRPVGERRIRELFELWCRYRDQERTRSTSALAADERGTFESERIAFEAAFQARCLELSWLSLDGRPVAIGYGYQCGGYVEHLRFAADSSVQGTQALPVLLRSLVADSFTRGDVGLTLADPVTFVGWMSAEREFRKLVCQTRSGPRRALQRLRTCIWL